MLGVWQIEQTYRHSVCGTFDWEFEENPEAWSASVHWCLACRDIELLKKTVAREHPDGEGTEGWTIRLYRGGSDDGL